MRVCIWCACCVFSVCGMVCVIQKNPVNSSIRLVLFRMYPNIPLFCFRIWLFGLFGFGLPKVVFFFVCSQVHCFSVLFVFSCLFRHRSSYM